jgi:hypothetical protein
MPARERTAITPTRPFLVLRALYSLVCPRPQQTERAVMKLIALDPSLNWMIIACPCIHRYQAFGWGATLAERHGPCSRIG